MIQDIALQVSAGGQCTSVLGLEKCRSIDRGSSVSIRRDINPICDRRVSLACPSCGRIGLQEFYDAGLLPVHNVLVMETYEEAISHPMGEVALGSISKSESRLTAGLFESTKDVLAVQIKTPAVDTAVRTACLRLCFSALAA